MLRLVGLAALLAMFVGGAAADAPLERSTKLLGIRALKPFAFDVQDGTYESQNVPLDCSINGIWLKARFTRLGKPSTKWTPGISLSIASVSTTAAIQIEAKNFEPPLQVGVVTFDLHSQTYLEHVRLYNTFDLETSVPVLASWSPDGLVTFNVGGETRTVNLKGPVLQATLSGSTAAGAFDPLEIGRIAGTEMLASCPKSNAERP
jgi:hypothetical protein